MYLIKKIKFLSTVERDDVTEYLIEPIGNIRMSITEYRKPEGTFYLAVMNIDDDECRNNDTDELVHKADMLTMAIVWLQSMVNEYVNNFLVYSSDYDY